MPIMQTFNKKTNAWVKFKRTNKSVKFLDVKQRNPAVPFKGVKRVKKVR